MRGFRHLRRWLQTVDGVLVVVAFVCVTTTAFGQTPATTKDVRRIYGNPNNSSGIRYNQEVGLAFQKMVLANMPGPKYAYVNTKKFPSAVRRERTGASLVSVIPDGVAGTSIGSKSPLGSPISTYPESTFLEVKAVKGKIALAYGQYQIEGMLDALSQSPAARSSGDDKAYPNMFFVLTGDASLAQDVIVEATRLNILLWLSYVTMDPSDNLQVASPTCLNCTRVLQPATQAPGMVLPGAWFRITSQTMPRNPVPFDPPILDDGLVGNPGTPGSTTPNP